MWISKISIYINISQNNFYVEAMRLLRIKSLNEYNDNLCFTTGVTSLCLAIDHTLPRTGLYIYYSMNIPFRLVFYDIWILSNAIILLPVKTLAKLSFIIARLAVLCLQRYGCYIFWDMQEEKTKHTDKIWSQNPWHWRRALIIALLEQL
jgi:hypothetical protein